MKKIMFCSMVKDLLFFPIRSETRKGSQLLPHLFNIVEKVLIGTIRGNNNNLNKEIK